MCIRDSLLCHLINRDQFDFEKMNNNQNKIKVEIKNINLTPGNYNISLWVGKDMYNCEDRIDNALTFSIINNQNYIARKELIRKDSKVILKTKWKYDI